MNTATDDVLPECVWRDTLALLDATFRRAGFDADRVKALVSHAESIGDDAEGWGLLDPEVRGTSEPITPHELVQGIVGAIQSDIYSVADDEDTLAACMKLTIYAAAESWSERVHKALKEEVACR